MLVVESLLCKGILGMDFLQRNTCSTTVKGECASICVSHTICIPVRSEMEIIVTAQGSVNNGDTYLLEGTEGSKSLVLVTRVPV